MVAKTVRTGAQALDRMLQGVDIVADMVATTMGPEGRAVLVGRPYAGPILLRNGYAVSQRVSVDDRSVQMGVQTMRELAWRTNDAVGDGTSTTILMARQLIHELRRGLAAGLSPVALEEALAGYAKVLSEHLDAQGRPASNPADIEQIAVEAAGDAVIGTRVAAAYDHVGASGIVRVEAGVSLEDASEFKMGMSFDSRLASAAFADDQVAGGLAIDNPLLILHRGSIADLAPVVSMLEAFAKARRGLVIVADDFEGDALATLILNKQQSGLKIAAVKSPDAGQWRHLIMDDLAIATGATVIDPAIGTSLKHLRPQMAGQADRFAISRENVTITAGRGDKTVIANRSDEIRRAILREQHLSYDRDQHRKRLARFQAGIATVRLGGSAEHEAAQRGERAENAVAAVRAALQGGIVPGGAIALIHAHRSARERLGPGLLNRCIGNAFTAALAAPLRAVLMNGHFDETAILGQIWAAPDDLCFDVRTRTFRPSRWLCEPLLVVQAALRNSVSCAKTLTGVGTAIWDRAQPAYHGTSDQIASSTARSTPL